MSSRPIVSHLDLSQENVQALAFDALTELEPEGFYDVVLDAADEFDPEELIERLQKRLGA